MSARERADDLTVVGGDGADPSLALDEVRHVAGLDALGQPDVVGDLLTHTDRDTVLDERGLVRVALRQLEGHLYHEARSTVGLGLQEAVAPVGHLGLALEGEDILHALLHLSALGEDQQLALPVGEADHEVDDEPGHGSPPCAILEVMAKPSL